MKAARIQQWGQPVQVENIDQPRPKDDEVLVRVRAAALNPVDAYSIAGYLQGMQQLPFTPGNDFAGDVVAVGACISHVKAGDAVFGLIPIRGGAFAEYATPKGTEVACKPASLDYVQAAAVPLAALTAWQALVDTAQVQAGERVLILGAAGGVGSYAIQFARDRGAHVIAYNFPGKEAFLQALGADEIINAQTQRFEDVVGKVDVVLNFANEELQARAYSVLKPGGRYVTVLTQELQAPPESLGIRAVATYAQPSVERLTRLAQLIDAGKLKVTINRTFPFDETSAALSYRQTNKAPGKVVLAL